MRPNDEIMMHLSQTPDWSLYRATILWVVTAMQRSANKEVADAGNAFLCSLLDANLPGTEDLKSVRRK